jgi:hypothetical protein
VSFIEGADQDPPETATPELEDELTGVGEAWRPLEVDVEVVPEDVAVLAVAPEDVAAVPGIVYALTAPRRPTPATAPKASPAVRRLSVLVAASRARIRLSEMFLFSMTPLCRAALDACCEKRVSLLRSNAQAGLIVLRPDSKLWIDALVAQGIEQDGPNVKVGGSIPSGGTKQTIHPPERAQPCELAQGVERVQQEVKEPSTRRAKRCRHAIRPRGPQVWASPPAGFAATPRAPTARGGPQGRGRTFLPPELVQACELARRVEGVRQEAKGAKERRAKRRR